MSLRTRLIFYLALVMVAWAGLPFFVTLVFFPAAWQGGQPGGILWPVSIVALHALVFGVLWYFATPIQTVFSRSRGPADADAALAAHRLPWRLAMAIMGLTAVEISLLYSTSLGSGAAQGMPGFLNTHASVTAASGILAAMLAYASCAVSLAPALEVIGGAGEIRARGTLRGKIVWLFLGVLTVTVLLVSAAAYAGFVAELEMSHPPHDVLVARSAAYGSRLAWLIVFIYCATAALVVVSARAITAPLRSLGAATKGIADGDLTVSAPSVSRDELGLLAVEFRRMARRLKGLLGDVREASLGVGAGAHDVSEIGERVRKGALEQHRGVVAVSGAVDAMQGSVTLVGKGVEGLSEYVGSTSATVSEMAAALEEIRRQGTELERAMANTMDDVDKLTAAGHKAESALRELETVASHAEAGLSDVNTSLNVLETAAVASQLTAAQANEMAERAGQVVEETAQAIENLRAAVGQAQRRVTSLGRRSDDIDHIVDFITEVAGRTNLLSLNASIIAAQAGEHGKAFAVVADQIRELASQISSSTKSIGSIIRAVREDVEGTATLIHKGDELATAGVALARNSLEAFHRMTGATVQGHETAAAIREAVQAHAKSSGEVSNLVQLIAKGSKAVGQAVDLVGRSVAGVETVGRGVETLADQVSRALQEQSGVGRKQLESLEQITGMVSEVTLLVENHNSATQSVRGSLQHLSGTAEQHEEAVRELGAVAERLAARAQGLAERVAKFRA